MRVFLLSFITFYAAASVAVTSVRTIAAAKFFDASLGQPGMRTPGPSTLNGALPKFREAKKVNLDFPSELPPAAIVTASSGKARAVSSTARVEVVVDPLPVLPRSPPEFT